MIFFLNFEKAKRMIAELYADLLQQIRKSFEEKIADLEIGTELANEVRRLRNEVSKLEITKAQKEEEYARREREVEHKVGLVKQRQEQEMGFEKEKNKLHLESELLKIQRGNLQTERAAFEAQAKFMSDRFTTEVDSMRKTLDKFIDRFTVTDNTNKER